MKFLTLTLLLFSIGLFQPEQQASFADAIAQAEAAYLRGDYGEAIQIYESLSQAGLHDGALYFDLGSAYYQSGDMGRALFNFRRAQQFMPRDAALNDHIALIRALRVDIQGEETSILAGIAALTGSVMTVNELIWLLWFFWIMGCGLLAAQFMRPQWRDRLRTHVIFCGVLFGIGSVLLGGRLVFDSVRPSAVLIEDNAAVMSGPGEQYLDLFEIHAAAELRIVKFQGDWAWIELPDGRQGWIPLTTFSRLS